MDKKENNIERSSSLYHGGPGSGRYPKGSTGNTPGSRRAKRTKPDKEFKNEGLKTVPGKTSLYKDKKSKAADKVETVLNNKTNKKEGTSESETATTSPPPTKKKSVDIGKVGTGVNVAGQTIANTGVSIAKATNKYRNANNMEDYKSMSSAELKAKVDRIRLENEYVNVSMAKTTAAQQKVEGFISIAGNAIALFGKGMQVYSMFAKSKD